MAEIERKVCDYSGLYALAKKAEDEVSESDQIQFIEAIAQNFPQIKKHTRSGATYGGRKRRSKKGGANKALVHTICLVIIAGAAYGSFHLGVAAASRLGYLDAAKQMLAFATTAIQGCGDVATGLARGQAADIATSAGLNADLMRCSAAWARLETSQARLVELTRIYGERAVSAGITISVAAYGRLFTFVESIIDGVCPTNVPQEEGTKGGARRRRRTYKKRGGSRSSCGMSGGKKRKTHHRRKSRGRKSKGRKSRGHKSKGRKSRGRKSRGRKSRRRR